ncbi:MAG: D-alanyl-D-alanine carboxypeptidase/D-alanyl-D-alanine-endopeptidase [Planctomycetes bacterium]|nr:D-alanyl-D-alanine carboxypeptidase/D-alanyl-D-alanine-endopeptidase [Planctomycetota bacterium]
MTFLMLANGLCLFVLWRAFRPLFDETLPVEASGRAWALDSSGAGPVDGPEDGSIDERALRRASPAGALSITLSSAPEPRTRDRALEEHVRELIGEALENARKRSKGKVGPSNVHVAVHVREAGRGGEVVALDSERVMRPASNLKLFTTAAALCSLGEDWNFVTRFESAAPIEAGVLKGDLVVRAGGDPLFDPLGRGKIDFFFTKLARHLKNAGIESVSGALVLDEGDFLEPGPGPAWPPSNQYWTEYCALSGGFSANAGCLTALVRPDKGFEGADIDIEPRWHGLRPKFSVNTIARGKLDLRVQARNGELLVAGAIPRGVSEYEVRFAAPDPVELFGSAALGALRSQGVKIAGGVRRERNAPAGRELARIATPLTDLLQPINTDSNNACADQVFLALGHARGGAGTREGGARATRAALERLRIPVEGFAQVDGSGLSRDDRVSAGMITALVDAVLRMNPKVAHAYVDSLAVGGATGTLEKRGLDEHVRAKTGFIAGTSALSGLVDTKAGRTLVFSILVEYPNFDGLNSNCWKPMQDSICKLLSGWDSN